MAMIAEKDNLTIDTTTDGRIVFEPGYAAYLRSQGYNIEGITEIDVIQSESDPEKKYLVGKLQTYKYPVDSPKLDSVEHGIEVPVCTCWNWRDKQSVDLETKNPSECGRCKHIVQAYREERARSDESQTQIFDVGQ